MLPIFRTKFENNAKKYFTFYSKIIVLYISMLKRGKRHSNMELMYSSPLHSLPGVSVGVSRNLWRTVYTEYYVANATVSISWDNSMDCWTEYTADMRSFYSSVYGNTYRLTPLSTTHYNAQDEFYLYCSVMSYYRNNISLRCTVKERAERKIHVWLFDKRHR